MSVHAASGFWILGVTGVAGGGLIIFVGVRALSRMVASRHWPTIEGRIIVSSVRGEFQFKYDYTVAGRRYISEGAGFGAMWGGPGPLSLFTAWREQKLVERYPVGRTVPVYYNPRRPAISALKRWHGVVDTVGFVIFGAVLFLVGIQMFSW